MSETFQDALQILNELKNYETFKSIPYNNLKNNLDLLRQFLDFLGNPQQQYLIVHVAGTKGKGSVCIMLDRILRQGKYRVGLFTSPHFFSLMERFCINGQPCNEDVFAQTFFRLRKKWEEFLLFRQKHSSVDETIQALTFFEWTVLIAFELFAKAGVQFGIIETGLGGRWDATNVCQSTVSVITSISFDHQEQLGTTLLQIASEKAGIIKKNVPVISGVHFFPFNLAFPKLYSENKIFEKQVLISRESHSTQNNDNEMGNSCSDPLFSENNSQCLENGQVFSRKESQNFGNGQAFLENDPPNLQNDQQINLIDAVQSPHQKGDCLESTLITEKDIEAVKNLIRQTAEQQGSPLYQIEYISDFIQSSSFSLLGEHQKWNAEIVWNVLLLLRKKGFCLSDKTIQIALKSLQLPGRMEFLSTNPLFIVDGAHNRASTAALMKTLNDQFGNYRKTLLFATTIGKDVKGMIAELFPYFDKIIITEYQNSVRALSLQELQNSIDQIHFLFPDLFDYTKIESCRNFLPTLDQIFHSPQKNSLELFCSTGSFYFIAQIKKFVNSLLD